MVPTQKYADISSMGERVCTFVRVGSGRTVHCVANKTFLIDLVFVTFKCCRAVR